MTLYLAAVWYMTFTTGVPSAPQRNLTLFCRTICSQIFLAWSGLDIVSALKSSISFFLPSTKMPPFLLISWAAQVA